jgi:hypothetical protein
MQSDIIGLSLFSVKDSFKKKLLTLYSHLTLYDHHPLRKLIQEFRSFLDNYIQTKRADIKVANNLFMKDNNQTYE